MFLWLHDDEGHGCLWYDDNGCGCVIITLWWRSWLCLMWLHNVDKVMGVSVITSWRSQMCLIWLHNVDKGHECVCGYMMKVVNLSVITWWWSLWMCHDYIDGLVQERRNSIANALELRLSFPNPLTWWWRWWICLWLYHVKKGHRCSYDSVIT